MKDRRRWRRLSPAEQLVADGQKLQYPHLHREPRAVRKPVAVERLRLAITKYSDAINLDRTLIDAYIRRASARRRIGDLRGARADAMTAYELQPRDPIDYLMISFVF